MTVQYYQEVLSAGPIAFLKLLRKWKGGVFKLIYVDFIVFSLLYAFISCVYRFLLNDSYKQQFEKVVRYVYQSQSLIPVAFILGFYVNLVFGRFWRHFNTVPWISKIAVMLSSHLNEIPNSSGDKEAARDEARLQKRSIIRYLTASLIITLSRVSVPVKRRFPTLDDLCTKGILLEHEVEAIKQVEPVSMQPFIPVTWSTAVVMRAGKQGQLTNEAVLINLVKEINKFRHMLQELFLLDQVCVPLVYTQVVTLAVYSYFLSCLIGRQFVLDRTQLATGISSDFYVPIFTVLQFVVYMGWLKLALTLVNPMGEDDEDFDLNCIVNYNFEVGLAIVDKVDQNMPHLTKDKFFDQQNFDLPFENNMKDAKSRPFMGSVYDMKVDQDNFFTSLRSIVTVDGGGQEMKTINEPSSPDRKLTLNLENIIAHEDDQTKSPVRRNSIKSRTSPLSRTGSTSFHFANPPNLPTTAEEPQDFNEDEAYTTSSPDVARLIESADNMPILLPFQDYGGATVSPTTSTSSIATTSPPSPTSPTSETSSINKNITTNSSPKETQPLLAIAEEDDDLISREQSDSNESKTENE